MRAEYTNIQQQLIEGTRELEGEVQRAKNLHTEIERQQQEKRLAEESLAQAQKQLTLAKTELQAQLLQAQKEVCLNKTVNRSSPCPLPF